MKKATLYRLVFCLAVLADGYLCSVHFGAHSMMLAFDTFFLPIFIWNAVAE